MWIDADTYRYLWVLAAELFQDRKVVYVELYPQRSSLLNLLHRDPIGSEDNLFGSKTCMEA